jgi:hypothetical protein
MHFAAAFPCTSVLHLLPYSVGEEDFILWDVTPCSQLTVSRPLPSSRFSRHSYVTRYSASQACFKAIIISHVCLSSVAVCRRMALTTHFQFRVRDLKGMCELNRHSFVHYWDPLLLRLEPTKAIFKVRYHVRNRPSSGPILSQIYPMNKYPTYLRFVLILSVMSVMRIMSM